MASNPLAHIQHEHRETFAVRVEVRRGRDVLPPVLHGIIRLHAAGKFVGGGFPHCDDFPFARAFRFSLWLWRPRKQIGLAHGSATKLLNLFRCECVGLLALLCKLVRSHKAVE